jgi:hypothetical protein
MHINSKRSFGVVLLLLFLMTGEMVLSCGLLAQADNSPSGGYSGNMKITSTVPFSGSYAYYGFENPDNNLAGWTVNDGAAVVTSVNPIAGRYSVLYNSTSENPQGITVANNYQNYTMAVKVKILTYGDDSTQAPMVCFYLRYVNAHDWFRAILYYNNEGSATNLKLEENTVKTGFKVLTDQPTPFSQIVSGIIYNFKVVDTGRKITAYVNDSLVINSQPYTSPVAVTQKGFGAQGVGVDVMFDDFTITVGNGGLTPIKVGYGYYTQNTLSLTPLATCTKLVVLDNKRYAFTGNGWGGFDTSDITAYAMDGSWSSESAAVVATQAGNFQDFYVAAYPDVWRDLIILYGASIPDGIHQQGFLVGFNTTTNSFQNLTYTPSVDAQYITGMTYSPDFNQFYLVTLFGSYLTKNQIIITNPSTLFNRTAWTTVTYDSGNTNEIRITYFSADKCAYFSYTNHTTGHALIRRWNITSNTITTVFKVPYNSSIPYLGYYIRSNSTTLFASFADNASWHFYYSNDGNNYLQFASLPIVSPSGDGQETHGDITPLPDNQVLIQSEGDGNPDSKLVLTTTCTGSPLETYYTNAHTNEIELFCDGSVVLINGEGLSNHLGAYATILTTGLHCKCKADFSDVAFGFQGNALAFNTAQVIPGDYAEFSVDTSPINGNTSFNLFFGKSTQTSVDESVSKSATLSDNQFLIFELVDATPPSYSNVFASNTLANYTCNFNATFDDDINLSNGQCIFGTNNTGSWIWEAPVNFTSTPQTITVTEVLGPLVDANIAYAWNFTDKSGNFNTTGPQTFPTTGYGLLSTTDAHSTINPSNATTCSGGTLEYSFAADTSYHILHVLVNDLPVSTTSPYRFTNVHSNGSIAVSSEIDAESTPTAISSAPSPTTKITVNPTPQQSPVVQAWNNMPLNYRIVLVAISLVSGLFALGIFAKRRSDTKESKNQPKKPKVSDS